MNSTLFEKVHDALNGSSTKIKLGNGLCERPNGSIGQLLYYERDLSEQPQFSRIEPYLESEIRGVSVQQLDRRVAMYGQVFSFRVKKDNYLLPADAGEKRIWSVYDWGDYADVPHTWNDTKNTIFEYGCGDRINIMEFTTPFTGRDTL